VTAGTGAPAVLAAADTRFLAELGQQLRVRQRALGGLPGSGTPDELTEAAGISASRIAAVARDLLKGDA
jgi:transketolase